MPTTIPVEGEIRLDQFLKWARVTSTGGQSKMYVLSGMVKVNGVVETRRGRLLRNKDLVQVNENKFLVSSINKEC